MNCRLCDAGNCEKVHRDRRRSYFRCAACDLVFVPESEQVTLDEERKRYDLHDNDHANEGYVRFLNEIVFLVKGRCSASDRILDYGCGRDTVLAGLLRKEGFDCTAYDPLYGIGMSSLSQSYDMIILCEVIEHLRDLKAEIRLLKKTAGQKGVFIVRTHLYPSLEKFPDWWYMNDITHINFFSIDTITTMAAMLGKKSVERRGRDIFILLG